MSVWAIPQTHSWQSPAYLLQAHRSADLPAACTGGMRSAKHSGVTASAGHDSSAVSVLSSRPAAVTSCAPRATLSGRWERGTQVTGGVVA